MGTRENPGATEASPLPRDVRTIATHRRRSCNEYCIRVAMGAIPAASPTHRSGIYDGGVMSDNRYVLDPENILEMTRLSEQGAVLTEIGGLLPEPEITISAIADTLDIACGPGEWCLQLAYEYPNMTVLGIDVSRIMIDFATIQAEAKNLSNVSFRRMSVFPS